MPNCAEKTYEILAPAGSEEQLTAAVNNGCDSVYLGLDNFNARMKAPNFTAENLPRWVDYCHVFGVKVYVTVNTSIKNDELAAAKETVLAAYRANADGVIVTDLALMRFAASLPKPFEVAASTQLNCHDGYGAEFLKAQGATTVVCARECTLEEISQIAATGVRVECFLHGALCVCQSGQCLFSSMVGGNSGNRGLCAQPCRKKYFSDGGNFQKGGYLLSPADNCSTECAQDMLQAGASVFKIEGRNRRAEYAGATSKVYSRLFESNFTKSDKNTLYEMYNRGELPQNPYLYGGKKVIYPYAPGHIGVPVGVVRQKGIFARTPLNKGDGLKVFDGKEEVCGAVALESGSGFVRAKFSGAVADGMTVRRTTNVALCQQTLSARKKLPVSAFLTANGGEQARLTLRCGSSEITVFSSEIWQKAQNAPLDEVQTAQLLQKTQDTYYTITDITVNLENVFAAKSQINALRRQAVQTLTERIISDYNAAFAPRKKLVSTQQQQYQSIQKPPCLVVICDGEQDLAQCEADVVIYRPQYINADAAKLCAERGAYLDLPAFSDNGYVEGLLSCGCGIVCHNVGQVQLARKTGTPYIAGTGLNIFNDGMAAQFYDAKEFFYSQELSLAEIADFRNRGGIVFVDGSITLMKLVHCPFLTVYGGDCARCKAGELCYTDEQGNKFFLQRRRDAKCTFRLINGKKLSVAGKLKAKGRYCVDYDKRVIEHYLKINKGCDDGYVERRQFTGGRLYAKIK